MTENQLDHRFGGKNNPTPLQSWMVQGFQSGDVLKIVAQRKSEWPELVTDKNKKTMSWDTPRAVYEYFHFSDEKDVYSLLRTPDSDLYRPHSGGIQLRYSRDGITPIRLFDNPKKFQVRKGKALQDIKDCNDMYDSGLL